MFGKIEKLISKDKALIGRKQMMSIPSKHYVLDHALSGDFPEHLQQVIFAMGCFWGVERLFWQQKGIYTTAVGYAGGYTENPSYEEVCSGQTGHTEVVLVVYDPLLISLDDLLILFWQSHDPTQGMRQGNDRGTQYRSAIYVANDSEFQQAEKSKDIYQSCVNKENLGVISTEIAIQQAFYYAESYHQQYLAKNPQGYCNLMGTGILFQRA